MNKVLPLITLFHYITRSYNKKSDICFHIQISKLIPNHLSELNIRNLCKNVDKLTMFDKISMIDNHTTIMIYKASAATISIVLVLPMIISSGDGGSSSSPIITVAAQLRPNHTYMPNNGVLNTGPPESLILSMPRSR
jgi:hypothetical protein